ncbi:hypothetical protein D3C76_1583170 [compost metagenome]
MAQPQRITSQTPGNARTQTGQQLQAFVMSLLADQPDGLADDILQHKFHMLHLQPSGFNLGYVENIVQNP